MGPKYEFTGETKHWSGRILRRIRRIEDGELGGWIESEKNLSQDGECWVDDNAHVYDDARVFGNAQVFWCAYVYDYAKVYGNAEVSGSANVYGDAKVYGNARVYDHAEIYGEAVVRGNARIYGNTEVCDEIIGEAIIDSGKYTGEEYNENNLLEDSETEKVVQDFIYKVDDSNKLTTQTEYDSVDEFFTTSVTNDVKLDTLVICAVDTKEPLIKLQKVKTEDKTEFKFIVEITNEDGDDFIFRSIIKSQEHLNQLIQRTVEALKQYPEFNNYADDLEEYL